MNKLRELDEKWHNSQIELEKEKTKNSKLESEKNSAQSKARNK